MSKIYAPMPLLKNPRAPAYEPRLILNELAGLVEKTRTVTIDGTALTTRELALVELALRAYAERF